MTPAKKNVRPRKQPAQSRSRQTVEWLLEATARIFRAEGLDATTNRIAAAAGVSVGTLYEYFPNKDALLFALAERHVAEAETGIDAALADKEEGDLRSWLGRLQSAMVASHRFPSEALQRASDPRAPELRARAVRLRRRVNEALVARARAGGRADPELRARAAFGLLGDLSSQTVYELTDEVERDRIQRHLLKLAAIELA
jgi:AcrR family transcriptional regulator